MAQNLPCFPQARQGREQLRMGCLNHVGRLWAAGVASGGVLRNIGLAGKHLTKEVGGGMGS